MHAPLVAREHDEPPGDGGCRLELRPGQADDAGAAPVSALAEEGREGLRALAEDLLAKAKMLSFARRNTACVAYAA